MNCFEARQDFVGFWRGALDAQRRRDLVRHLKECSRCDRAFRAFALTAPVLHLSGHVTGEIETRSIPADSDDVAHPRREASSETFVGLNGPRRADAGRAAEIMRRASSYPRTDLRPSSRWRGAAAGFSAIAAAVLLAYFSVAAPSQSFDEAVMSPDAISETSAPSDGDFLGQQVPMLTPATYDIAG